MPVTLRPAGPGTGVDAHYVHDQNVPSATWTVVHNLGKHPSVEVVDSAGTLVVGQVVYLNNTTCEVHFAMPFSGTAYCN